MLIQISSNFLVPAPSPNKKKTRFFYKNHLSIITIGDRASLQQRSQHGAPQGVFRFSRLLLSKENSARGKICSRPWLGRGGAGVDRQRPPPPAAAAAAARWSPSAAAAAVVVVVVAVEERTSSPPLEPGLALQQRPPGLLGRRGPCCLGVSSAALPSSAARELSLTPCGDETVGFPIFVVCCVSCGGPARTSRVGRCSCILHPPSASAAWKMPRQC